MLIFWCSKILSHIVIHNSYDLIQLFIYEIGFRHVVILSWEPDGNDLFGMASCPSATCRNVSFQLSLVIPEARSVELLALCLYSFHCNWCHFPSSPSSPQEKKRTGIVQKQMIKNLANKRKSLVNLGACYCLGSL
uniref:Uncharacterized protein n=1 Tax=Rhinopithecus bieti TaxID=61621 RepID=A0A2K6LLL2_RHIBE